MSVIRLTAEDGSPVEFDDATMAGSGGMKDVYFSTDRSYVVAWFRKPQDAQSLERLRNIVGPFREKIFNQPGGEYWKSLYCWPTKLVHESGYTGIVVPAYDRNFFFEFGSKNNDTLLGIKGKEKEGKWFASANHQQKHLDPQERGDWLKYLAICIKIARACRRMHAAGLAHSDLSYKNVLVDPRTGNACLIDIDGLVVHGKFPPEVLGTPDFIAPEVMRTLKLPLTDPRRNLPRRETDQHALAVLIYMYLLYRHPLRGGRVHDTSDPQRDEELTMGEKALFVEHPADRTNRPNLREIKPSFLPYADVNKLPYTLTGPYLKALFERAFMEGLHDPARRPTADEWEHALVKTVDLIQPCPNPNCDQKWFVFESGSSVACPFCRTPLNRLTPVLAFFSSSDGREEYRADQHRLVVYHNQYLYPWHVSRRIVPNEKLQADQRKPVAYFIFHQGKWLLVNQTLPGLKEMPSGKPVPPGSALELVNGGQILLSAEEGGRLLHVQLIQT
ncbi:MAG: lipopolysaccharide kinase InaA family protein [Verrucomicrobiota bacterium]